MCDVTKGVIKYEFADPMFIEIICYANEYQVWTQIM